MKKLGFTYVFELKGGMNKWLTSGEKTVKMMSDINMNLDVQIIVENNILIGYEN